MKTIFQTATLITAFVLAALTLLNFPVGAAASGPTHGFTAPAQVFVDLLTDGRPDRLGAGRIVYQ